MSERGTCSGKQPAPVPRRPATNIITFGEKGRDQAIQHVPISLLSKHTHASSQASVPAAVEQQPPAPASCDWRGTQPHKAPGTCLAPQCSHTPRPCRVESTPSTHMAPVCTSLASTSALTGSFVLFSPLRYSQPAGGQRVLTEPGKEKGTVPAGPSRWAVGDWEPAGPWHAGGRGRSSSGAAQGGLGSSRATAA